MAFEAKLFRYDRKRTTAIAWCEQCNWRVGESSPGRAKQVFAQAKTHTEETGHVAKVSTETKQQSRYEPQSTGGHE